MASPFVPEDFDVPVSFTGPTFHLEPLGPQHNERDYAAWTSSMDHIRATPGFVGRDWPHPMTLEKNLEDLEMHDAEFVTRSSFTYSILEGDEVFGCIYIYPGTEGDGAEVRSWVTEDRKEMDVAVWSVLHTWIAAEWPFRSFKYQARPY